MDLNASSMSESLAISLALEWKFLQSFHFLLSKNDIVLHLNVFNSLNNSFNLFLITGLVLISGNSGSKSQHYNDIQNYQNHLIPHVFYFIRCS